MVHDIGGNFLLVVDEGGVGIRLGPIPQCVMTVEVAYHYGVLGGFEFGEEVV